MATWEDMDCFESKGEETDTDFVTNANNDIWDNSDDEEVDFFDLDSIRQAYNDFFFL